MLRAKHNGKDSIQYFDSELLAEFMGNLSIENKLRDAIYDMRFEMYFQPQYQATTGDLRGVEALIRWQAPEEGMISPAQFIPLAEKNGTIVPIGQWVIEDSIRTYMQWRSEYDRDFILSINISAIQYKRDDFVRKLIDTIEKYGMNPADLELEITETALIDNYNDVTDKMKVLRDYGVRISMDDFGTGYSSLSYLKSLPIDTLKIDKTFVDTVLQDENSNIIMESIMGMVKKLGLETVAEGVEKPEQLEYLKSIHCDNIQGFLTGKPQREEDIESILKA
jgi:EAL domain-containing protein (putative c-di-GMP-specific phosphodiesterase class I)